MTPHAAPDPKARASLFAFPPKCPFVEMSHDEALRVFVAVDRSRQRLVAEIARTKRARTLPQIDRQAALCLLQADLAALSHFAEALGTAHAIGGY